MARIEQVIHVKGTDGEVRECALFDSASDIPSPATAREFGLNGAKIYGAVLDGGVTSDDGEWVRDNSGTELAFHDGSSESHLLTTPYFVRPKTDALEFGADGGTVYLEDSTLSRPAVEGILSTNGTLCYFSCDRDFISFVNAGNNRIPSWTVVCAENTSASERSFTLALTYGFDDGSTQDITFTGTQATAAAAVHTVTIRCATGDAHITIYGEDSSVLGEGSGYASAVVADGAYVRATAEHDAYKPWSGVWESVTEDIDEWITLEAYYIRFDPDTLTWDSGEHTDDVATVYTNMDFTVESDSEWLGCYKDGNNVELRCLDNEGSDRTGTVTATGVEYSMTAKLTITQKGKGGKLEIWFEDDPAATEKTIELKADGSAITVPFGWSEETTQMEIDADYWGTKADGMLSVVVQGHTYNEYVSNGRVGSPMIYIDEPTGELTHTTRVIYFSATDDSGAGGNTLRIYVNISE